MIDPEKDGIDHINVYSKGETKLGRALSNFAELPFKHPLYGKFASMEGYWYWVKTGKMHEHFREYSGFYAKKVGKQYEAIKNPNFELDIRQGIKCKLYQRPNLFRDLLNNNLPLKHYYCYGGKVVEAGGFDLCKVLEDIKRDFLEECSIEGKFIRLGEND